MGLGLQSVAAAAAAAAVLLPSPLAAVSLTGQHLHGGISRLEIPTVETEMGFSLLQQKQQVLQQRPSLLLQPDIAGSPFIPAFEEQEQQQEQQQQEQQQQQQQEAADAAPTPAANETAAAAAAASAEETKFSHRERELPAAEAPAGEAAAAAAAAPAAAAAAGEGEGDGRAKHISSVGYLPPHFKALDTRMQKTLKEIKIDLNKQTGGSLPEYGEAGPLPMLCGTWQTLPESPAFEGLRAESMYSEADSSLKPAAAAAAAAAAGGAAAAAAFETCQWLPQQQQHIVEVRTFRVNPPSVTVERKEYKSAKGCLPQTLHRVWSKKGTWKVVSERDSPAIKTRHISINIEWESAVVRDYPQHEEQQQEQQQQQQQQQQQGEDAACAADGDSLWVSAAAAMPVDVAAVCALSAASAPLYSADFAAEFLVNPQGVAVSHQAIRERQKFLNAARLAALKETLKRRKKTSSSSSSSSKTEALFAPKRRRTPWSVQTETLYKQTWKHFLAHTSPWTQSLCPWERLRNACFEPPFLEVAEALNRQKGKPEGKYKKGETNKTACSINRLPLQLSRHPNGVEFLTVPVYPYDAATADILSFRKVSGCNDGRDIVKPKGPPKRHTAAEEQQGAQ